MRRGAGIGCATGLLVALGLWLGAIAVVAWIQFGLDIQP